MGGELSTIEGHEAAQTVGGRGERRASTDTARAGRLIVVQGAHARPGERNVAAGGWPGRVGEITVVGGEQVSLLLGRADCSSGIALVRHIGRAYDEEAAFEPVDDEDHT